MIPLPSIKDILSLSLSLSFFLLLFLLLLILLLYPDGRREREEGRDNREIIIVTSNEGISLNY